MIWGQNFFRSLNNDQKNPINVYGIAKVKAENLLAVIMQEIALKKLPNI